MKKLLVFITTISIMSSAAITIGCEKQEKVSKGNKEKLENVQLQNEKDNYIDLDVYFDASKDENTIDIAKEELLINKEELMGELVINQLIKGPSIESKLKPILPKDTRLISFSIKDGIAIINFSKEAMVAMSPGKEEACLKSIAKSITQLDSIEKIRILVENQNVDSLGGNFNISKTFSPEDIASLRITKEEN
ncbi:GerMN domain-containing protein [Clostridium thermarum]|uniref:GerMN domain-containing protein n=1 Tax=Clostridium thermarum TaxID=1716543 RepID=UPI00111ED8D2|nr:GerMN domain-containing protein [Clostridium thermarum]